MAIRSFLRSQLTNAAWYDSALAGNDAFIPITGVAGYAAGGNDGGNNDKVDKLLFATDTFTLLAATLVSPVSNNSGASNRLVAGYSAGGNSNATSRTAVVEKIVYATDTRAASGSNLGTGVAAHRGMTNSGTAGYFAGGQP